MKRYILLILIWLGGISLTHAQDDYRGRSEKIQALKIAFITQRLNLTSAEAEKLWPVYDQYEGEIRKLYSNKNDDVLKNEQKLLDIRKKYKPAFEKILGPQRLNQLFIAEKDFRDVLIKRLKNQNQRRQR